MKTRIDKACGPFATPARAKEIALIEDQNFGLPEFTELTGVGVPGSGIYQVRPSGISVGPPLEKLGDFTPAEQHQIHEAARALTLSFPCTPAEFMRWYDASRGTNGVSDFPLAKGFAEELRRHEGPSSGGAGPSVPSGEIVAAFKVLPADRENFKWWDLRLRNPGRYRLTSARALRGVAQRPSRWYPVLVAGWLIDEKRLARDAVLRAMRQKFPDSDLDLL
jgi:hypothetical protein